MGNKCQWEIILFGNNSYCCLRNMIYGPNIGCLPLQGNTETAVITCAETVQSNLNN